jgi:murein DD-endopeptidase / murein LD-carboxypeptidase
MLKKYLFIFCMAFLSWKASAQNIQERYQRSYFSEELGYEIDTIINPGLYSTVVDWLSTHYRYGGKNQQGIDCSGFASVLYRNAYNLMLSGGSARIFAEDVVPVEKENLQEGDLVFFRIRKKRISHVGVYLGKNKFAHATRSAGVVVSDLNDPYYRKYYYKAGRHKSLLYANTSVHAPSSDPCAQQPAD